MTVWWTPYSRFASAGTLSAEHGLGSALLAIAALLVVYRVASAPRPAGWRAISFGALVGTNLWLLATVGLDLFIGQVAQLGATYGSLAGVVVLLLWLLVTAYAVLFGAQINAEVQRMAEPAGVSHPRRQSRPAGSGGTRCPPRAEKLPIAGQCRVGRT